MSDLLYCTQTPARDRPQYVSKKFLAAAFLGGGGGGGFFETVA